MIDVGKATAADAQRVATTLASAFGEDPVVQWMCGRQDTEQRMGPFWRSLVRIGLSQDNHEIYLSADGDGAAVWRGIDQWKLPTRDVIRSVPAMAKSLRQRLPLALQLLGAEETGVIAAPKDGPKLITMWRYPRG